MPSDIEAQEEIKRESIWSVKEEDRPKFSIYFIILFLIGLAFVGWYEIFHVTGDSVFDTIIALMRDIGLVGIASVVLTFARFEGEDSMGIALDLFRKYKYQEWMEEGLKQGLKQGIEQGREQGIEQGVEQGRAEGRAERDALRKRIAELESRNGSAPNDDGRHSDSDGAE